MPFEFDFKKFAEDAATAAGTLIGKAANKAEQALNENAIVPGKETPNVADIAGAAIAKAAGNIANAAGNTFADLQTMAYHPLFPDEYANPEFDRPKIVVIEDKAVRKDIEVCNGAIGWLRTTCKPEVMYLYEEFVDFSGLRFYPIPTCKSSYLRDPFDSERYIEIARYLATNKADQVTELKQIAQDLGAKYCSLASYESTSNESIFAMDLGLDGDEPILDGILGGALAEVESLDGIRKRNVMKSTMVFHEKFIGGVSPKRPQLKWFKNDPEMLRLIEARCSHENTLTKYHLDISSVTTSTMNSTFAQKIDASLGTLGFGGGFSLSSEFKRECSKRLIFTIEF